MKVYTHRAPRGGGKQPSYAPRGRGKQRPYFLASIAPTSYSLLQLGINNPSVCHSRKLIWCLQAFAGQRFGVVPFLTFGPGSEWQVQNECRKTSAELYYFLASIAPKPDWSAPRSHPADHLTHVWWSQTPQYLLTPNKKSMPWAKPKGRTAGRRRHTPEHKIPPSREDSPTVWSLLIPFDPEHSHAGTLYSYLKRVENGSWCLEICGKWISINVFTIKPDYVLFWAIYAIRNTQYAIRNTLKNKGPMRARVYDWFRTAIYDSPNVRYACSWRSYGHACLP